MTACICLTAGRNMASCIIVQVALEIEALALPHYSNGCWPIQPCTAKPDKQPCLQVNIGNLEFALLDTRIGNETIPCLRLATSLNSSIVLDTQDTKLACYANSLVACNAETRVAIDVTGNLSSRYFNSNLNVEEALLSVRF